jgi:putative photosynthetic complex assembly protein
MTDMNVDQPLPRGILYSGAALAIFTFLAVAVVQLTGEGKYVSPVAPVTETRQLHFVDRPEGGVAVVDAQSGSTVEILLPGHDGFIRATVRTMAQERMRRGLARTIPFELKRHVDGRITFEDPLTARVVSLEAFGATNRAAFERLLVAPAT